MQYPAAPAAAAAIAAVGAKTSLSGAQMASDLCSKMADKDNMHRKYSILSRRCRMLSFGAV